MTIDETDRKRILGNCRIDAWQRLGSKLATLHVPAGTGPEQVIEWLGSAFPSARPESQRVMRAIARLPWRVDALTGPYENEPRLGFRLSAGSSTWWLQFRTAPTLYLHRIERVSLLG